MPYDSGDRYWMGDDDGGGFFDDSGGDDGGDGQDGDQEDDQDGDDQDDDQDGDQDADQDDGGADGDGGDNGNDNGGDNGDDDVNDEFSDPADLMELDDDTALSASDFPNATEADFEDDDGSWTPDDYQKSAGNLFGDHEFFGDTLTTQLGAEGYQPYQDDRVLRGFDQAAPGSSETVRLFERDGQLHAFGFVSAAVLEYLMLRYSGVDFSNLDVAVPPKGEPVVPKPLPPAFDSVQAADAVDLRKYCTPVGDQGQTSRCSAFAWTHATELVTNMKTGSAPRLSPTFTMLEFQRMQGDAEDYEHAYTGGDGTVSGEDPGHVLVEQGTCREELWPDASEVPVTSSACCYPMRTSIILTQRRIRSRSRTFARCSARAARFTWR